MQRRNVGAGRAPDLGDTYFRSRWERNWARYLNFLVQHGEITGWEYEPKTFWFHKIKRGTRSYKPDFIKIKSCLKCKSRNLEILDRLRDLTYQSGDDEYRFVTNVDPIKKSHRTRPGNDEPFVGKLVEHH